MGDFNELPLASVNLCIADGILESPVLGMDDTLPDL